MIVYLTTRKHAYTLGIQLHFFPGALGEKVRLLPYEELGSVSELPEATYVFTDFDRLPAGALQQAGRLWDWLDCIGGAVRLLNCPWRSLMRFDLLRKLHDEGVNDFNVYRLDDWRRVETFPAFIRRGSDHRGPITALLRSPKELSAAVVKLQRAAEYSDLMIVEFGNRAYADGRYRKFGAFRIGDQIYGQHCYITRDWLGKGVPGDLTSDHLAEAEAYRVANPHKARLLDIFRSASIEYGRMDYAIVDGRVQVFEINTNPTVLGHPYVNDPAVRQEKFAIMHEESMLSIDSPPGSMLGLPDTLLERSRASLSIDQIHARALSGTIRRVNLHYGWKLVRRPLKTVARGLRQSVKKAPEGAAR